MLFNKFVNCGMPQGTVSGPNDFKLIINDLQFDIGYVKFVDDTTTFTVSNYPHNCLLQKAADHPVSWTNVSGMVINTSRTQEMVVYFGKQLCVDDIPLICINGRHIKKVVSFKLLGVVISSDLTWDAHVSHILSKSSKRIYCSVIRSVLEYACPVWHPV